MESQNGEVMQSYLGSSLGWATNECGVSIAGRGGRSNAVSFLLFLYFRKLQEANDTFSSEVQLP